MGLNMAADIREQATRIFLNNLAMHYQPATFLPSFFPFAGWQLAAMSFLIRGEETTCNMKLFRALYGGLLGLIILATIFSSLIFFESVARLFVLRIAPISLMFAQMIVTLNLARAWIGQDILTSNALEMKRLAYCSLGLVIVIAYEAINMGPTHANTIILAGLLLLFWLAYYRKEKITSQLNRIVSTDMSGKMLGTFVLLLIAASAIKADFRPATFP